MTIDYRLSKLAISCFRGIENLELDFRDGFPSVLIGSNNAGKSTVLNAIALALGNPSFYQWSPTETDFFCDEKGTRASKFLIQIHFHSDHDTGYPAVKGIQKPTLIHGVQVKGRLKDGRASHSRTLLDEQGKTATIAPRTPLTGADKEKFKEHAVNYTQYNARLDDISDHTPEVWLFRPQNIEASLYVWKTGPIAKLSKLLAERFLSDKWEMKHADGKLRPMPGTMYRAYEFFQASLHAFPFWKDDLKPHLEGVISRYVGSQAKIDLKPDIQAFEEWIAQQLAVSLATDPDSVTTPLRSMGDGWQSIIRLAALEALTKYPDLMKERVVLLLEEPETHLHPHLSRKLRKVLASLSAKGWTIVYSTHSPEMVSFDEKQVITRLVRSAGAVTHKSVHTDKINPDAKLQSKLDERGAHDFLFASCAVFCEGKDDSFAIRLGFEKTNVDYDARSVSITQCGSVTAIPAFVEISTELGIRWCALTDEDRQQDGTVKPNTERARTKIEKHRSGRDKQVQWPTDLEHCFGVAGEKVTPEISITKLSDLQWQTKHPQFKSALSEIATWIDPTLKT
jgi:energy-coupling factor transporter ATP-binding protein EcfA2